MHSAYSSIWAFDNLELESQRVVSRHEDAEKQTKSFERAPSAINYWTISLLTHTYTMEVLTVYLKF